MDVWAAGCIFAELLNRRPFLQVKMFFYIVWSINLLTNKYDVLIMRKLLPGSLNPLNFTGGVRFQLVVFSVAFSHIFYNATV